MSNPARCSCPRCSIRGLMGPLVVTTIGILFLLSEIRGGHFHIVNTFPVLLIVIGIVLLGSALAPMNGHIESPGPAAPPATPPAPPPPPPASNYSSEAR